MWNKVESNQCKCYYIGDLLGKVKEFLLGQHPACGKKAHQGGAVSHGPASSMRGVQPQ